MPDPQQAQLPQVTPGAASPTTPDPTSHPAHPIVKGILQMIGSGMQSYAAATEDPRVQNERLKTAAELENARAMREETHEWHQQSLEQQQRLGQERIDTTQRGQNINAAKGQLTVGPNGEIDPKEYEGLTPGQKAGVVSNLAGAASKGFVPASTAPPSTPSSTGPGGPLVSSQGPSASIPSTSQGQGGSPIRPATSDELGPVAAANLAKTKVETGQLPDKLDLERKRVDNEFQLRKQMLDLRSKGLDVQVGGRLQKLYEPAQDADTRYKVMLDAAKNPTAQGDVSLLFNHIGMTLGAQKGARITNAEIDRAIKARSIPQDLLAMWERASSGQMLTPEQRENMVSLASQMREQQWAKADQMANTFQTLARPNTIAGDTNAAPPVTGGTPTQSAAPKTAADYLKKFQGANAPQPK